jgi:hypothetical protein
MNTLQQQAMDRVGENDEPVFGLGEPSGPAPDIFESMGLVKSDLGSLSIRSPHPLSPTCTGVGGETPLSGHWHHGNGHLACGTLRIARWDCDTNPPEAFREELLGWMCEALNAAQAGRQIGEKELIEVLCARIKSADDIASLDDYMLDSDDCIAVLRGQWTAALTKNSEATP